jgi:hydrogenase maturation protein HypF
MDTFCEPVAACAPENGRARWHLEIGGVVQGVGFRPFVFSLARAHGLSGYVLNGAGGAVIEVEGPAEALASFAVQLVANPPPQARLGPVARTVLPPAGFSEFEIRESGRQQPGSISIPADLAVCRECAREVLDPADRHHRYPFTNCTRCGPRFTVVEAMPYDRTRTAMRHFPMCGECSGEFGNPADRRFHAQPVACPVCGPQLELLDADGALLCGQRSATGGGDPLQEACRLLAAGSILAVKGLGGFHLACDAANESTVRRLRALKGRPARPLAIMCRDLAEAEKHCHVSASEAALLLSPAAPVVLMHRRQDSPLSDMLCPGVNSLGVMLPYTPLHMLLLLDGPPVQVMTSGNRTGLPMVTENAEALRELGGIADAFLVHDRKITNRCDDSVMQVIGGSIQPIRRSRGYTPEAVRVPPAPSPGGIEARSRARASRGATARAGKRGTVVLAVGADGKNTCCLLSGAAAFPGQHVGDVDSREAVAALTHTALALCRLAGLRPDVVVGDLHPGYRSTRAARELARHFGAALHPGVQHHHAHFASCLAENADSGPAVGAILDGTGYGLDGRLWGFELLHGDLGGFHRGYHLAFVPLPGGEQAIRRAWVTAAAYLIRFLGAGGQALARSLFADLADQLRVVERMVKAGFNSPEASSCGRLFDAVAAILGLCRESRYEAEAPARLASLLEWVPAEGAGPPCRSFSPYPYGFRGEVIDPGPMLAAIVRDMEAQVEKPTIARRFHDTVAAMVAEGAERLRTLTGLTTVALSGGVWQNRYLLWQVANLLQRGGFEVLRHRLVPPNDGGISLGQATIAAWQAGAWDTGRRMVLSG